jgi:hypothetical protein
MVQKEKRMKGAFVVLSHTHVLINDPGPNKGKFQVHELVEFVDMVRNKHLSNATAIMDVKKRKLLKNRARDSGAGYDDIERHVIKGYKDKYREFLDLVGAEYPADLFEAPKPKKEETEETVEEKPKKKRTKKAKEESAETNTD